MDNPSKGLAIVSGGTYGAGRAIARALLADDYAVAAFSNDPDQVAAMRDEVASGSGMGVVEELDVRDFDGLCGLVKAKSDEFGPVRALVNNAGIRRTGDLSATTEADWDEVIDVNLKGQFLLAKAATPSMIEGGGGAVVNFASVSAYGGGSHIAYIASKSGVLGLTKAMAYDLARHKIRVNAIVPGFILSGMSEGVAALKPELLELVKTTNVAATVPMPEDYARVVQFLLCDQAALMTGAIVDVGSIPGFYPDDSQLF